MQARHDHKKHNRRISIFNEIHIHVDKSPEPAAPINVNVEDNSKREDGIVGCFRSCFKSCRR